MKDSPRKRYIRLVRQPSLETKAGFLVLLAASLALGAALGSASRRLSLEAQLSPPALLESAHDDSLLSQ